MGGWLRQRKNPFQDQGLVPGLNLRLEVQLGERLENLVTTVEEVDSRQISVLVPMAHQQRRHVPMGSVVHVEYTLGRRLFRFTTEALGPSLDGNLDYLGTPVNIEATDRRRAFRLETILRPLSVYRIVVSAEGETPHLLQGCSIVDLSEGGVRLSSRTAATANELLGLEVNFPGGERLNARMRVISAHEPPGGRLNWRIHCEFVNLPRHERESIAHFLMQRQRQRLQEGRL